MRKLRTNFSSVTLMALTFLIATPPADAAAPRQVVPPQGVLLLWGGGEPGTDVVEQFSRRAAGSKHAVFVLGDAKMPSKLADWAAKKHDTVQLVSGTSADIAHTLATADVAWVNVAAIPPGAVDSILLDSGFLESTPANALIENLATNPGVMGLGLPSETGLIIDGRSLTAVGASKAVLVLPASVAHPKDRPVKKIVLAREEHEDLVAISRASIARLGPEFPLPTRVTPEVPAGSLLLCGGGELPDVIWKRFIELAGGPSAPIVVLPVAAAKPDDLAPKGLDRLKALGAMDLTVLIQRTHADVEKPAFADALRRAKGIWFVGGRQWKYVDAYEGTVAEQLFKDVLSRGGVIGGTSAGTAYQADYMVRGNPLGNGHIMAEGYERGLRLLAGTAIDIHVTQRGRLDEMPGLIQKFPSLLGLSLDEETAAEVHGHVMSVLGNGQLSITEADVPATLTLKTGQRYDLAARKKLD